MQGFLAVVSAMVLQAVDELSDEGGAPRPGPPGPEAKAKAVPEAKSSSARPKQLFPKAKTSAAKSTPKPKATTKRGGGMKKPAARKSPQTVPEPAETETPTAKGPMKRPASEEEKPLPIRKNYYKTDQRYGFVVGKREVMYVTSLHSY